MYTERGFAKKERLCGKKQIDRLFAEGKGFIVYPFRVVYRSAVAEAEQPPVSLLISVPKRNIKRANRRNLVKRHVRESFRLQKQSLYMQLENQEVHLDVAIIYLGKEIESPVSFFEKTYAILQKLADRLS